MKMQNRDVHRRRVHYTPCSVFVVAFVAFNVRVYSCLVTCYTHRRWTRTVRLELEMDLNLDLDLL